MAVVQNTLIGKSRQSIGGATFSTWKGINVLKTKPTSVANPQSDKQMMQRSALQQMVAIYRIVSIGVKKGWKKYATQKSEYNAFTSNALKNAFNFDTPPVAELNPELLKITNGTITSGNEEFAAVVTAPDTMEIDWVASLAGNQAASDEVQVAVISSDATRVKAILIDKQGRSDNTYTLTSLPDETFVAGDVVLFGFTRADYSDASIGSFVLATV